MDASTVTPCLIIFVRYPQPGQVKTRLIPALGAEGAASLYQQMAEHTVAQVRLLQSVRPLAVEVWFTGGSMADMKAWLGDDLDYYTQPQGELGDRLTEAFHHALNQGHSAAFAIGTDCPSLTADILQQGIEALQHFELVLGPATDGGYYLIGMQRLIPALFQGISWSTADVLKQTVAISDQLGLTRSHLPQLADVDTAEDLQLWEQVNAARTNS